MMNRDDMHVYNMYLDSTAHLYAHLSPDLIYLASMNAKTL